MFVELMKEPLFRIASGKLQRVDLGVFLSREKPTVRYALVRITLVQPIALTLSRFIFRLLT